MKKPLWILIGMTLMFACVLIGLFWGRNSTHNYIPINNISSPPPEETSVNEQSYNGKININTADIQQLTLLPGIGETIAERIVAYRSENGGFTTIEDLMKVSGIGEKKFEQMKPYVKVE